MREPPGVLPPSPLVGSEFEELALTNAPGGRADKLPAPENSRSKVVPRSPSGIGVNAKLIASSEGIELPSMPDRVLPEAGRKSYDVGATSCGW